MAGRVHGRSNQMVVMSSTPAISGQKDHTSSSRSRSRRPKDILTHTCPHVRMMMMSHFGHEAIFTLDYTINENQTFDCLMPGTKGHLHHQPPHHHAQPRKCCNFAKIYKSLEKHVEEIVALRKIVES